MIPSTSLSFQPYHQTAAFSPNDPCFAHITSSERKRKICTAVNWSNQTLDRLTNLVFNHWDSEIQVISQSVSLLCRNSLEVLSTKVANVVNEQVIVRDVANPHITIPEIREAHKMLRDAKCLLQGLRNRSIYHYARPVIADMKSTTDKSTNQ